MKSTVSGIAGFVAGLTVAAQLPRWLFDVNPGLLGAEWTSVLTFVLFLGMPPLLAWLMYNASESGRYATLVKAATWCIFVVVGVMVLVKMTRG